MSTRDYFHIADFIPFPGLSNSATPLNTSTVMLPVVTGMSEQLEQAYPLAGVWLYVLDGIFSTLGRIECLAGCRDAATRRYGHKALAHRIGEEETHCTIAVAHQLVWRSWLKGSLEQQHADLLLYLRDLTIDMRQLLIAWSDAEALILWAPDCANSVDKDRFQSDLTILLDLLRNEYDAKPKTGSDFRRVSVPNTVIEEVRRFVDDGYPECDLTLERVARKMNFSTRHLGRLFHKYMGQSFRKYLSIVRIQKAAELLLADERYEVKAVACMVGYSSRSHFDQDFEIS